MEIGTVLVTYRSFEPILIEPGDEVRVLGEYAGAKSMEAVAYVNVTRDVMDDNLPRGESMDWLVGVYKTAALLVPAGLVILYIDGHITREMIPGPGTWVLVVLLLVAVTALAMYRDARRENRCQQIAAPLLEPAASDPG